MLKSLPGHERRNRLSMGGINESARCLRRSHGQDAHTAGAYVALHAEFTASPAASRNCSIFGFACDGLSRVTGLGPASSLGHGPNHCSLRTGGIVGHAGAPAAAALAGGTQAHRHCREPRRRRHQYRHVRSGARQSRRHDTVADLERLRRQSWPVQKDSLRSVQGFRADRRPSRCAEYFRREGRWRHRVRWPMS